MPGVVPSVCPSGAVHATANPEEFLRSFAVPAQRTRQVRFLRHRSDSEADTPAPELALVNPPTWSPVCSIPLLSVPAVETHDAMIVPVLPADGAFAVQAPASPCEDKH